MIDCGEHLSAREVEGVSATLKPRRGRTTSLGATTGQPTFTGGTPLTTTYAYDEIGDLHSVALPNGDMTTYECTTI